MIILYAYNVKFNSVLSWASFTWIPLKCTIYMGCMSLDLIGHIF